MFQYLTVFLLFLYGINGQIIRPGKCTDLPAQKHFSLSRMSGLWYEAEGYPIDFEKGGSCVTKSLTMLSDKQYFEQYKLLIRETGERKVINGTSRIVDSEDNEAIFDVIIYAGPNPQNTPFWVLETDYDNYASLWSCSQVDDNNVAVMATILTRYRSNPEDLVKKGRAVFDRFNISRKEFLVSDQANC